MIVRKNGQWVLACDVPGCAHEHSIGESPPGNVSRAGDAPGFAYLEETYGDLSHYVCDGHEFDHETGEWGPYNPQLGIARFKEREMWRAQARRRIWPWFKRVNVND